MNKGKQAVTGKALTIPNLISALRFLAVPFVIYFMLAENWTLALLVFPIAGISDAIDGYIARSFNQMSDMGAYLDPLADKALMVAVFIILSVFEALPLWVVVVIVARDVFIVGGVVLAAIAGSALKIAPIKVSKLTTVFQIALAAYLLAQMAGIVSASSIEILLIYGTAILTLVSASAYGVLWFSHISDSAERRGEN